MSSPPPEPADARDPGAPVAAAPGTRRRAGNAMGRARTAILDGARRCLAERGPKGLTMSAVADRGGVAKATVYNHFRSRDELVVGLAVDTVQRLPAAADGAPDLAAALTQVAVAAAGLPELRGAVAHDPAVVAAVVRPAEGPVWAAVREAVGAVLTAHGAAVDDATTGLVLRWLAAVAVADPGEAAIGAEARTVAAGLATTGS